MYENCYKKIFMYSEDKRMEKTTFMKNLELLCEKQGISVRGLCLATQISTAAQTNWRNGALPNARTQKKIADYFGVSIDELMGIAETMPVLTDEHYNLVKCFDKLNNDDKRFVMKIVTLLSKV